MQGTAVQESPFRNPHESAGNRRRLLFLGRGDLSAFVIRKRAQAAGFVHVEAWKDPADALEEIRKGAHYNAAVMDSVSLGTSILRMIRIMRLHHGSHPKIIVVVPPSADAQVRAHFEEAGADAVLSRTQGRPFFDTLTECLKANAYPLVAPHRHPYPARLTMGSAIRELRVSLAYRLQRLERAFSQRDYLAAQYLLMELRRLADAAGDRRLTAIAKVGAALLASNRLNETEGFLRAMHEYNAALQWC